VVFVTAQQGQYEEANMPGWRPSRQLHPNGHTTPSIVPL
jgi:hypothetical protein